jgi:hypothetical protein
MSDNPFFKTLEERYFQGEYVYNYGGFAPQLLFIPPPPPSPSPSPSITPTNTPTPSITPTNTPTPSITPTITPSITPSITPTITLTPSPTITLTSTSSPTPTPSAPASDADANAYLSAVVSAGGTGITPTISAATTTMFVSLKSAGLYTKLYTLYPMLGGNYAGCKFNAKNPLNTDAAYRLLGTGANTWWSSKGFYNGGTNNYANSYFNPTTAGVSGNSFCMFAHISISGTTGYDIGGASLNAWFGLSTNDINRFRGEIEMTGFNTISNTGGTLGFQSVSRTNATEMYWVRDGGAVNTFAVGSPGGIPNTNIFISAYQGVGAYTHRGIATCGWSSGLSTAELGNLRDIINTFESNLTR